jgi:CO dehydrogenase maturation factor
MCGAHAAVRSLVGELVGGSEAPALLDIEAGLEHLSRGTARNVEVLLAIAEPYFKSMETAARVVDLARELGIPRVMVVANKLRSGGDAESLGQFFGAREMEIAAMVPDDEGVREADRLGVAPLDLDPDSLSMQAIAGLAERLMEMGNRR